MSFADRRSASNDGYRFEMDYGESVSELHATFRNDVKEAVDSGRTIY